MRVLLLAPQPFFVERGTPIAVRALASALCRQGHEVDLLALHGGEDVAIPGLRLFRAARPPFVRAVPIGFSFSKLACDVLLIAAACRLLLRRRYDVIHAMEETIFPALLARLFLGVTVVQDMDSLMVDQIVEKWPRLMPLGKPLNAVERFAMRRADAVVGVCPHIVERIRAGAPRQRVFLLPDIADPPPSGDPPEGLWDLRGLAGDAGPLALYVGNLEGYQGVDLLVAAMAELPPEAEGCRLVVVGGKAEDVAAAKEKAARLGLGARVVFTGPAPLAHLPWLLRQADILCSPRRIGVNTPMKIYSYMAAARPIVATRIASHTQVLDENSALLVDPDPIALAEGIAALAADPALRRRLGEAAAALARDRYGPDAFDARVRAAYAALPRPATPEGGSLPGRDKTAARVTRARSG